MVLPPIFIFILYVFNYFLPTSIVYKNASKFATRKIHDGYISLNGIFNIKKYSLIAVLCY